MDRCDDPDPLRLQRRQLATEAAAAVLHATLDPSQTNDQKMAAVEVLLDKYLTYSPGCTFANNWCYAPPNNAPEKLGNGSLLGCSVGGPGNRGGLSGLAVLLGLLALLRQARRRHRAIIGMTLLFIASLLPSRAFAQAEAAPPVSDTAAAAVEEKHSPPPPVTTPVKEPGPKDPSKMALGAYLGGSGSYTYAAAAVTLGARLRFSKHWTFGFDAEWNPWIAINGRTAVRAGAFNGYGTVILRLPLAYEQFNLRTTANLGFSRLLIDLYGAPKGSTGIYAGLSPLGLEWKVSRLLFVILNPLNFAMPMPQLNGVPFSYSQYRVTIGLEVYGG
jgi:hypothetical protein